jgi:Ni/Co efflux regulator RcnB
VSTPRPLARYFRQIRYWITLMEIPQMNKLLVALIAAAFTAGAYAQAPKSETAPATKAEKSDKKSDKKAQKKSTEKKSTKAKSKSKSDAKPADKMEKKDGK